MFFPDQNGEWVDDKKFKEYFPRLSYLYEEYSHNKRVNSHDNIPLTLLELEKIFQELAPHLSRLTEYSDE